MLEERLHAEELMDDPALPVETYTAVLHDLAKVNRIDDGVPADAGVHPAGSRGGRKQSFSVLDVGFGDGDMLRRIAALAKLSGQTARLVGVDLNANSVEAAREVTPSGLPIEFFHGDYATFADCGAAFTDRRCRLARSRCRVRLHHFQPYGAPHDSCSNLLIS